MYRKASKIVLAMLLCALVQQVCAQDSTINLNGKVVDASMKGIAGVTITVKDRNLSAITNAEGKWSIGGSTAIHIANESGYTSIDFLGQYLQINMQRIGAVKVSIVDLFGKQSKVILNETLASGQYTLNLSATPIPKGVWIVRVQAANESKTLKWVNTEGSYTKASVMRSSTYRNPVLTKSAGEKDSLIITYNNTEVARVEQANLLAGTLSDFVICAVTPVVVPLGAGTIQESLPIYILFGDSFTVNIDYDQTTWRLQNLFLGTDTLPVSGSQVTIGLTKPTDQVSLGLSSRDQTITFSNISPRIYGTAPFVLGALASSGLPVSIDALNSDVCISFGDSIHIYGVGVCELSVVQAGDDFFNPISIDTSFKVNQANQQIVFDSVPDHVWGESPFQLTATSNTNEPIVFVSKTPTICSLNQYLLSMDSAGTCIVQAMQSGNINFIADTVTRTFQVIKAAQTISIDAIGDLAYGSNPILLGLTASSGLAVTATSTTPLICTVSGKTLTVVSGGSCKLTLSQAGNSLFAATAITVDIPIAKADQQITFTPISDTTYKAGTIHPTVTTTAGALAIVIASNTPLVCSVTSNLVTMLKSGTCSLVATQAGDDKFNAAVSDVESFEIFKADQTITFTTIGTLPVSTPPFTPTVSASSGLPVVISSRNNAICTVNNNVVTLVTAEGCQLVGTQAGNDQYNAAQGEISFNSSKVSQTITFDTPTNKYINSPAFDLAPSTTASLPVILTSNSEGICTVSGLTVSLVGIGTCSITASAEGDANHYAAVSVTKTFPVYKATQTLVFDDVANFLFGEHSTFEVKATSDFDLPVTYASTTTSVCSITGTTVSVLTIGSCIIKATQLGNTQVSSTTNSLTVVISKGNQTITSFGLDNVDYSTTTISLLNKAISTTNLAIVYTSATPTICSVTGTTMTLLTSGTCTINANQAGNTNYNAAATATASFEISKASQSITFTTIPTKSKTIGSFSVASNLSTTSGLTPTLNSLTTDVCTVSSLTITLVNTGTCIIQADQEGNAKFQAASTATQSFQVN